MPAPSGARRRHPSARARGGQLVATAARLGAAFGPVPGPHADVAAAVAAVRGAQGRTLPAFAAAYGLAPPTAAAIEDGRVAAADLPAPLLVLTPVAAVVAALAAETGTALGTSASGYGRASAQHEERSDAPAGPSGGGQGQG